MALQHRRRSSTEAVVSAVPAVLAVFGWLTEAALGRPEASQSCRRWSTRAQLVETIGLDLVATIVRQQAVGADHQLGIVPGRGRCHVSLAVVRRVWPSVLPRAARPGVVHLAIPAVAQWMLGEQVDCSVGTLRLFEAQLSCGQRSPWCSSAGRRVEVDRKVLSWPGLNDAQTETTPCSAVPMLFASSIALNGRHRR